jgi:hypothetical protein
MSLFLCQLTCEAMDDGGEMLKYSIHIGCWEKCVSNPNVHLLEDTMKTVSQTTHVLHYLVIVSQYSDVDRTNHAIWKKESQYFQTMIFEVPQ